MSESKGSPTVEEEAPAQESPKKSPSSPAKVQEVSASPDNGDQPPEAEVVAADDVETAGEAMELPEGGWWGSWISAAKSKSVEVLGMVRKDLDEIGTAVKSEATHVISSTSTAIGKTLKLDEPDSTANTMKKSFSTFLDQVNTVLNPSPDDDDTEALMITDGDTVTLTTLQRDLVQLQCLDATYLVSPTGAALARMAAWLEAAPRPSAAALQRQLKASPELQDKMLKLVPHAVSADDFWERYLFRKALLEDRFAQSSRPSAEVCSDEVVNSLVPSSPIPPPASSPSPADSPSHGSASSGNTARSNYGSSKSRSMDFDGTASGTPEDGRDLSVGEDVEAMLDEEVAWDSEYFASNIELSEEQQIKLLHEYEQEMMSAKQISNSLQKKPSPDKSANTPADSKAKKTTPSKSTGKKGITDSRSKSSDAIAKQIVNKNKPVKGKNVGKVDEMQSKLVEDHFVDDKVKKSSKGKSLSEELGEKNAVKVVNDAGSSNSDESWEKEFEIDELRINSM